MVGRADAAARRVCRKPRLADTESLYRCLAFLLLADGRRVSFNRLAQGLYPETDPVTADAAVRTIIRTLRTLRHDYVARYKRTAWLVALPPDDMLAPILAAAHDIREVRHRARVSIDEWLEASG